MSARDELWSIYRQALPVLLVALCGGLFSGLVLESLTDSVERFPGLLVMVPVFLATRGNVYGALGGRIASGLHQGLIEPRFEYDERLVNAVVASFVNAIAISLVIAFLTTAVLSAIGWPVAPFVELAAIMLVAGVSTSVLMIAVLLGLLFWGYGHGYDPDNLVGPIVTTVGDVFGMCFLVISVRLVGVLA